MEMDVNLVRCLRSTVGMSDIDRCYNEFVINGLNTPSIINHNNSNQNQQQQQQPHHHHHQPQQLSLITSNKSNNNINFNYNSNHQNASSSSLTASYQIKPPSVSLLRVQPSTSMATTTTEITSYEKYNRPIITTISGNLVNNETNDVNNHLSKIHNNNNVNIHHNDDVDNDDGDDDDDDDNSNEENQSNIINDNRIDYQQYCNNSMSSSIATTTTTPATTVIKKSSSAAIISQLPPPTTQALLSSSSNGGGGGGGCVIKNSTSILLGDITTPTTPISKGCCITLGNRQKINKTPQEIYFESRGKSCKKLLKFNGYSNKILLYPEESWARSAASSYWTIKPSWWQPNRCKVTEITGSQRYSTKAKMLCIEKGSLLVMGSFKKKLGDSDFKLYLSSNITMEDYNMGYCLTGWVERRCSQTNTFQMTHFAVIKRQWPPSINTTTTASNSNNNSNSANNNANANAAAAASTNDSKSN